MSNPGPFGAPGPVSVKVRQKVTVKSGPVSGPGPLSPSNPGGLAPPPESEAPRPVKSVTLLQWLAEPVKSLGRPSTCEGDAHCAAAELRLVAARVAGVGSTAVLYGWVWNVACERVWLLVVVCTNICRSLRKVFVQIGGPTHPRPFASHERTCGMRHSALAPARWECAMSSKSKRR